MSGEVNEEVPYVPMDSFGRPLSASQSERFERMQVHMLNPRAIGGKVCLAVGKMPDPVNATIDCGSLTAVGLNLEHTSQGYLAQKPTNPKDRVGTNKAGMSIVPIRVVAELGVAMTEGALKYGPYNYRESGVRGSIYFDATLRHLFAWWEGEDIDPDSGLSHVAKAIASLAVLRDGMMQGNWTDDRAPKVESFYPELHERTQALKTKYPPC